jgi:polyhydroxyalkanoate synthesis regulator phasin
MKLLMFIFICTLQVTVFAQTRTVVVDASGELKNPTAAELRTANNISSQTDMDAVEADVDAVEVDVGTLQSDVATAEDEIDTLQSDVTSVEADVGNLQTSLSSLEEDVEALGEDLADVETAVSLIPEPKYPVFVLQVPYGAPWTDFEIKATQVNFAGGSMVYYYHSPGASVGEIFTSLPDVWYTDSQATENRAWIKQPTSPRASIAASLVNVNSEVGGIIVVLNDPILANMSATADLVFSFVWLDATSREEDLGGEPIWRPVVPTQWAPATYQP